MTEFNPAAEKTFGYSRAEAMGKPLVELIVPTLHGESQILGLAQCSTAEKNSFIENRLEMTAVLRDGTKFPAELAFTTIGREGPCSRPSSATSPNASGRSGGWRRSTPAHGSSPTAAVMDETIPKILQAMCENLGWRLGQMWQMDPKAGLLRCVAVWHEPAAAVAAFADLSRKTTLPPRCGAAGPRLGEPRTRLGERRGKGDLNFPRAEEAARCGLHGAFAFPILHGEEVLGVMEFFHENILEPDGPLLAMIAAVGSQVGQFIERMRTDEALRCTQELLREAESRYWITRVAQRTAELSDANEFLKALLDNVQDGIVACNAEGELTLMNRAIREFHGTVELPVDACPIRPCSWTFIVRTAEPRWVRTRYRSNERFGASASRTSEMVIAPKRGNGTHRHWQAAGPFMTIGEASWVPWCSIDRHHRAQAVRAGIAEDPRRNWNGASKYARPSWPWPRRPPKPPTGPRASSSRA